MTDRESPQEASRLRELVRSAPRTAGRNEAFLALVALEPPGLTRTLRSLALDDELDRGMRLQALTALAQAGTTAGRDVLRTTLDAGDEVVRRRAVARLGKIGTVEDLDRLRAVRTGNQATQRTVRAAKCFLSYRHGLGAYRFDAPHRTYRGGTDEAQPVRTGTPTKTLRRKLDTAGVYVPGVELDLETVWRVECPTQQYVLLLNRQFVGAGMAGLAEQQAMLAVLVTQSPERGTFEPALYLATDPAGRNEFHVSGVRSSGVVAVHGRGRVGDGRVTLELAATDQPVLPPLDVEAAYTLDSGRLRFGTAQVEPRFAAGQQQRRRRPREG